MQNNGALNHIFVDFENVREVNLEVTSHAPFQVTLLLGANQRSLALPLVRQLMRQPDRFHLIEVGASGRNALDLTLAYYLGQAVAADPEAKFFIISKDKDYDAMIKHLTSRRVQVSRHDTFAGLPIFGPAPKAAAKGTEIEKVIARLHRSATGRPKRKKTLLSHINSWFANKLTPDELEAIAAALVARDVVAIDDKDRVSYTSSDATARD